MSTENGYFTESFWNKDKVNFAYRPNNSTLQLLESWYAYFIFGPYEVAISWTRDKVLDEVLIIELDKDNPAARWWNRQPKKISVTTSFKKKDIYTLPKDFITRIERIKSQGILYFQERRRKKREIIPRYRQLSKEKIHKVGINN